MNRVKELRQNLKFTQKELAEKLNMATTTLASIESGQNDLTAEKTKLFAKFFNVSADYLLGLTNIQFPTNEANFIQKEVLENLTENDKKLILDLATNLAEKNRGGGIL